MKFAAVTTFNERGLEEYGKRMVNTFGDFWPREVPLYVYGEGWTHTSLPITIRLHPEVHIRNLLTWSPWLAEFKAKNTWRNRPNRARLPGLEYRWDAVRFSHKVAALCHAAQTIDDADILIWLDGDIVTHAPVTVGDLTSLAPTGDAWIAWLDRARLHPECGFVLLNARHPRHCEMIDRYERLYTSGALFMLPEWHDSFALQHIVRESGVAWRSLSGPEGRKTNHPLVNGPLGAWFDHLKGDRKRKGKTPPDDLRIPRQEAYWR